MKHEEFMTAITNCYDPYKSSMLEQITFKYIKERFKESELDGVFKTIIIKVNPKFKTPPSPADFEEHFPKLNLESEAHKWYDRLNNTGCALDNIIVSEIRAEKALDVFGGWVGFASRKPDNEIWDRKNFVQAFINAVPGNDQPSIQYGESSRRYENLPLIFGDKEFCQAIIDNRDKPLQIIDDMVTEMKI